MFLRSCIKLATHLFETFELDYENVISAISYQQIAKWKTLKQQRCKDSIYLYIKTNFKYSESLKIMLP
jgi:hypothetical protein